jgi:uncharacterized membrane protein
MKEKSAITLAIKSFSIYIIAVVIIVSLKGLKTINRGDVPKRILIVVSICAFLSAITVLFYMKFEKRD